MKKVLNHYVIDALILIIIGLVMLFWHDGVLKTIFLFLGIALILMGAIKMLLLFLKKEKKPLPDILFGIVQVAAGILLIVKTDFFIGFLPTVAAVILLYGSILMFIQSYKNRGEKVFVKALVPACMIFVLALIIFMHPVMIANVMLQATGVSLILEGMALIITFSGKRNEQTD